jgi:hypothetical protein
MIIYLPLLISIIGLLMYALSSPNPPNNPKLQAIGLHMFWVGLLAFLLIYHGPLISAR